MLASRSNDFLLFGNQVDFVEGFLSQGRLQAQGLDPKEVDSGFGKQQIEFPRRLFPGFKIHGQGAFVKGAICKLLRSGDRSTRLLHDVKMHQNDLATSGRIPIDGCPRNRE